LLVLWTTGLMQLSAIRSMHIESWCNCRYCVYSAFIEKHKPHPKPRFFKNLLKPTASENFRTVVTLPSSELFHYYLCTLLGKLKCIFMHFTTHDLYPLAVDPANWPLIKIFYWPEKIWWQKEILVHCETVKHTEHTCNHSEPVYTNHWWAAKLAYTLKSSVYAVPTIFKVH